ncbi:hypothetical protein QP157_07675 [Sphingomonas sp. LR61]
MRDPADLDAFVDVEGDGDDLGVEVIADEPGGDRVPAEADHEVEDRRPVRHTDLPLARHRRQDLLRQVEGVVRALVERQPRQVGEVLEGRTLP